MISLSTTYSTVKCHLCAHTVQYVLYIYITLCTHVLACIACTLVRTVHDASSHSGTHSTCTGGTCSHLYCTLTLHTDRTLAGPLMESTLQMVSYIRRYRKRKRVQRVLERTRSSCCTVPISCATGNVKG